MSNITVKDFENTIRVDFDSLKELQEFIRQSMDINVRSKRKGVQFYTAFRIFIVIASEFAIPSVLAYFLRKDRTTLIYHTKVHNDLMEVDRNYRLFFTRLKNSYYES